ncbi:hypothetical protein J3458_012862 [Metarhizium acridum]|uniref:uncharacterized protein n=1 Tax=Metarhizium acridum TaxID=92637 RepID=UPI001C6B1BBB|nr:hypothetical protein J3458_012862 [Metarhizium acridum]
MLHIRIRHCCRKGRWCFGCFDQASSSLLLHPQNHGPLPQTGLRQKRQTLVSPINDEKDSSPHSALVGWNVHHPCCALFSPADQDQPSLTQSLYAKWQQNELMSYASQDAMNFHNTSFFRFESLRQLPSPCVHYFSNNLQTKEYQTSV